MSITVYKFAARCRPQARVSASKFPGHRAMVMDNAISSGVLPASSELELIHCAAERDQSGYDALCRQFSEPLHLFATRLLGNPWEAEDVVEEVFRKLWNNVYTYDQALGTPFVWALTMVRDAVTEHLREGQRTTVKASAFRGNAEPGAQSRPRLAVERSNPQDPRVPLQRGEHPMAETLTNH